ncbi:MAG: hypothetical protein J5764_06820 [Bacteroidales bacterium]|nr:hypothetical protein [Bacteroidales bacterium]
MKRVTISIISAALLLLLLPCLPASGAKKKAARISVSWEPAIEVTRGGYARVHKLNDGSMMLCYSRGGDAFARFSGDQGASWSDEVLVMRAFNASNDRGTAFVRCANAEFVQLSANHPAHPGRIIYCVNLRPKDNKSTVHPFAIACSVSDDGGRTWSPRRSIYDSRIWDEDASKGAWEPFAMELPDGTLQVYFTDNTPYFAKGDRRGNNISVVESRDGGDSWSSERIVCHSEGGWDGMPVVTVVNDRMYLSVEHKDERGGKVPMDIQLMTCSLEENWNREIDLGSQQRFSPYVQTEVYEGAPYIIHTDNYFVVSFQSADGAEETLKDVHSVPEIRICPITEAASDKLGRFYGMQGGFRPMNIDQTSGSGLWNSLCHLEGDRFLCVTQHKGSIYLIPGTITAK